MIRNPNGYINDTAKPLYCFGHGLSYTTFAYSDFKAEKESVSPEEEIHLSLNVTNTGDYESDEVVQLYFSDDTASMVRPEEELAGFCRIHLRPGQTKKVSFTMKASQLAFLNEDMKWVVEKGPITFMAGASCDDIRQKTKVMVAETGEVDGRTRGFYAAAEVRE